MQNEPQKACSVRRSFLQRRPLERIPSLTPTTCMQLTRGLGLKGFGFRAYATIFGNS